MCGSSTVLVQADLMASRSAAHIPYHTIPYFTTAVTPILSRTVAPVYEHYNESSGVSGPVNSMLAAKGLIAAMHLIVHLIVERRF